MVLETRRNERLCACGSGPSSFVCPPATRKRPALSSATCCTLSIGPVWRFHTTRAALLNFLATSSAPLAR